MRSLLALIVVVSALTACSKKKGPQAPTPPAADSPSGGEAEMRDEAKPDDPDEMPSKDSADPCAGGE